MLAIRVLCSRSIDDIVVRPDKTEGEGDDSGKDEGEYHGRNEGLRIEL
jgi:hypothetical protein